MNQGTLAYWATRARKGMESAPSAAGARFNLASEQKIAAQSRVQIKNEGCVIFWD